jgi:UDP-N-acetylglucosamine diphosphorylase/glucosamine-1-phosphate N-acetyltransferase
MFFSKAHLYPFNLIREIKDIRAGILTIAEKWELIAGQYPEEYRRWLSGSWPQQVLPGMDKEGNVKFLALEYPWHIAAYNEVFIRFDVHYLTQNKSSSPIPAYVTAISPENIFIEEGAEILPCIINASDGPVYIGKNALIMEGCCIRGPFALCEGAVLKMGAKIYGATTIGPYASAGGEIKNSVIMDYSNKAHDGYLGDSVIGTWCNLGAGTTNSNVKNTAGEVKVFVREKNEFMPAGRKCGLIMGDYSKSSINTSFNTGTVVGIAANVFGKGLTPKYIPDFAWGMEGEIFAAFDRLISSIHNWMDWKGKSLQDKDILKLKHIFEQSIKREI